MGKYKRLKKEHDNLKEDFDHLVKILKSEGSLTPHCGMCNQFIGGNHTYHINNNKVDISIVQHNVKRLEKFLGVELKHTDEWEYLEREDTDE